MVWLRYWIVVLVVGRLGLVHGADDYVSLSAGGSISGASTTTRVGSTDHVVVSDAGGYLISIPKGRISHVKSAADLAQYRRHVVTAGEDPERHYQLAVWCKKQLLHAQHRYHLQRAIAIDPNHRAARVAAGYKEVDGRWEQWDLLQRRRGLVRHDNKWQLPEVVAREEQQKELEVQSRVWVRKLTGLLKNANSGNAEAIAEIEAIDDPLASAAIAQQLDQSRRGGQPTQLRLVWVKLLGRLRTPAAVEGLTKAGVMESDPRVRLAALEELTRYGTSSAVATYENMLKSNNHRDVVRAAVALQAFPDPEHALTYVDALITQHTRVGAPPPGMSVGTGNGVGGMSMGGGPTTETRTAENLEVRNLLKQIAPGVDYGYDEDAWRRHFASRRSDFSGDLRRDR